MIIDRIFSPYAVFAEDTVLTALNKISQNNCRMIFAVQENGYLEGVLTDGDIRRWLTSIDAVDLSTPVSQIINRDFTWAYVDDAPETIAAKLSDQIAMVPLLDRNRRMAAVAQRGRVTLSIGGRAISDADPAYFIAEIGNNHNGDLELAYTLIDRAAAAGADCAKFQMRDMSSLYAVDSESPSADLGTQYTLDLLSRFQLSDDDLFRAFDYAAQKGLTPLCTPWDASSFEKLERYGVAAYKIASADFTNYDLIRTVATARKPMICSTGMARESEIVAGARMLNALACPTALLHCNSTYPAPFKDINLAYLARLKKISNGVVGYSGHERDINIVLAAVALGAKILEKHFTLDREMEGNDHKVSLLPDEFARMAQGARQIEEAMGADGERVISQGEMMNRETLAKSLAAAVDIPAGAPITEAMITVISPGQGVQPNRKNELIGKRLAAPKKAGAFFFASDVDGTGGRARDYAFPLKWGVPVRYHDLDAMRAQSNLDLVEIHLSYKDMDLDFREFIPEKLDLGLVVHAPELFAGDHTLDFCAEDEAYRRRSIAELQRVIDLTRALKPYFTTRRPCIVANLGGFSKDRHLDAAAIAAKTELLVESLKEIDEGPEDDRVEVIAQTMPPFPWHFGGQQFHNLFVDPDWIDAFCRAHDMRICFDTSHSKLAAAHLGVPFSRMVAALRAHTAHLHLADATGVDGEGVQIGDGEIDWRAFWRELRPQNLDATFIPEIWQGHKNNGEGAWIGLDRLERSLSEAEDVA